MNDEASVTPERSAMMAKIKARDTRPELVVRRWLHRAGYRFRLHRGDLPGRPDIVLPRHRTAVFVHGCFWHRHPGCARASTPHTRQEFWLSKFSRNVARDSAAHSTLQGLGWRVLIIWECGTRKPEVLANLLKSALDPSFGHDSVQTRGE